MGMENELGDCPVKNSSAASIALGVVVALVLVVWFVLPKRRNTNSAADDSDGSKKKHHVVITGGSQGIGLALAHEFVRNGTCGRLTILARTKSKLETAQKELVTAAAASDNDVIVDIVPVDVSDAKAIQVAANQICETSTPNILFHVAGTSSSSSFLDTPVDEFGRLVQLNYLGSVYATKAFLPHMLANNKRNNIMFTSSAAGQVGIYGYSAYTPTKYALRGFVECLQMEHASDNVHFQLCFPPDTDTPGYAAEQIGKPKETHLISECAGLFQPQQVAQKMADCSLRSNPPFFVYFGLEGWMLATLTAGMSPLFTLGDALYQICLMSILRLVSIFYIFGFYDTIHKARKDKEADVGEKQPLMDKAK